MSNIAVDIRVVGQKDEVLEFISICKVIQHLGRIGCCRKIPIVVDGDGSGRLAFYGIKEINPEAGFIEFNSNEIDVEKIEEMWIGE